MRRFSGLLTRSRFSFFAVIFLIFLSLLLFYTENNIISLKKLLEKANYPSVEDLQYNLLGIAGEKNHCANQQSIQYCFLILIFRWKLKHILYVVSQTNWPIDLMLMAFNKIIRVSSTLFVVSFSINFGWPTLLSISIIRRS